MLDQEFHHAEEGDRASSLLRARAIQGDRDALGELLFQHYDRLYRFVATRIPARAQTIIGVEDVLQDTFVLAFRAMARFEDRGADAFAAWLQTLADRSLRDRLRAWKRQKRGGRVRRLSWSRASSQQSLADLAETLRPRGDATPSQLVARDEAIRAIQVGIAALPDDQRDAIRLRYLDHHTVEEAAANMERTSGAIRGLVHRAKQSLRHALGKSTRWFTRR